MLCSSIKIQYVLFGQFHSLCNIGHDEIARWNNALPFGIRISIRIIRFAHFSVRLDVSKRCNFANESKNSLTRTTIGVDASNRQKKNTRTNCAEKLRNNNNSSVDGLQLPNVHYYFDFSARHSRWCNTLRDMCVSVCTVHCVCVYINKKKFEWLSAFCLTHNVAYFHRW